MKVIMLIIIHWKSRRRANRLPNCSQINSFNLSLLSSTSTNSTHKFEQNKKKNHYNVYTSLKKIKEKSLQIIKLFTYKLTFNIRRRLCTCWICTLFINCILQLFIIKIWVFLFHKYPKISFVDTYIINGVKIKLFVVKPTS